MQVALSETGVRCVAWKTEKVEGPFSCPGCFGEVILRKGKIREHHYAHKPPFDCIYGAGETQIHYRCKREIFEALSSNPKCSEYEIEKPLDRIRPDVYAVISSNKVAIEVQKTIIDINDIERKLSCYKRLGVYVLWLIPQDSPKLVWHDGEQEWVYRLKEWEKYLHAVYYGRVYYWNGGLSVSPYHFDKFQIWVNESEWYDQGGKYRQEGGYYRDAHTLKRSFRCPKSLINIVEDFFPRKRRRFDTKNWSVPECNIWLDSLSSWW